MIFVICLSKRRDESTTFLERPASHLNHCRGCVRKTKKCIRTTRKLKKDEEGKSTRVMTWFMYNFAKINNVMLLQFTQLYLEITRTKKDY
jgi:hypothetical protein